MSDTISRQAALDALKGLPTWWADEGGYYGGAQPPMVALLDPEDAVSAIENLPSAQSEPPEKYEYHYDHTDCIWYRPEARNRCPSTCAQYRDGWNDAINYIYRDGKGYRPYRRGEQYGE